MRLNTLLKKLVLITAIFSARLSAFQVVDVEIPVQMKRNAEQKKVFIVDVGERNRIAQNGNLLAVLRKDEFGSLLPVGILEITATASRYCKTKVKTVVENQFFQPFGIKGIAVGDSVFPLVMLPSSTLFYGTSSAVLSKSGMELLSEKVVAFLHEGQFKNMLLFSYADRGLPTEKEAALAESQANSIKKHLMAKHGVAEGMLKITIAGKNNPFNKILAGSRQDFLFAFDGGLKQEIAGPAMIAKPQNDSTATQDSVKTGKSTDIILKPQEIESPGELILNQVEPVKEQTEEPRTAEPAKQLNSGPKTEP